MRDWPECPHCPGEELINDPARPGYYECGYCNRKYPASDFDKPVVKKATGDGPEKHPAPSGPPTRTSPQKEGRSPMAAIKASSGPSGKKEKETTMDKQQQKRLANINYRAKKMGHAPPFTDLDAAEQWAAENSKRKSKHAAPKAAHAAREVTPPKARRSVRGGYKKRATPPEELTTEPLPTPAAVRGPREQGAIQERPRRDGGNGHVKTARAIALEELDKMIASLTSTRAIMASLPAEG